MTPICPTCGCYAVSVGPKDPPIVPIETGLHPAMVAETDEISATCINGHRWIVRPQLSRHAAAIARLALQPLLDKANAARIKHAAAYHVTGESTDKAIATAAEEAVAVLEKHISQLSENG